MTEIESPPLDFGNLLAGRLLSECAKDNPTLAALPYEASCEDGGSHSYNPELARLEGGGPSLTSRDHKTTAHTAAIAGRVAGPNTYSPVGSKNMRCCANRRHLTEPSSSGNG